MSNDNKTLADVQPGGRVKPGDAPWPEIDAILADAYSAGAVGLPFEGIARRHAVRAAVAALSAQPSPGGQGDALEALAKEMDEFRTTWGTIGMREFGYFVDTLKAALAARQPVRIYGCCAQREGELHTTECPNLRHLAARQPVGEPVAWMTHHDEPMLFPTAAEASAYCDDDEQPVPLFRSPAQAVDLGQFRPAVRAMGLYAEEPEDVDEAKRLMALIDSQAVGNGN